MQLRPYQRDAVSGVERELLHKGLNSTLVVCPTATGKTVIFAKVAEMFRRLGRILVLAHREELIEQAGEKIRQFTDLTTGIEMGEETTSALMPPDVVIASVQSLHAKRRERFAPESFALIIIDEAHHATAQTYRDILRHFRCKVLGVTATPDRADGTAMGGVFQSVAFVYEIRDAIEQEYIVPIRQHSVHVEHLDLSDVKTRGGDFAESALQEAMCEARVLDEIAIPTVEQAGTRPTIVFTAGVEQAHALSHAIDKYSGKKGWALPLDGGMDRIRRRDTLRHVKTGAAQFLVNCALLTEGFDFPPISCVAVARPTKSRALYAQMVGRGFRLSPETGKSDLLVLDFKGNAGRHQLVNTLDILDGNEDAQIRARAERIIRGNPQRDVLSALVEAEAQIAAEKRAAIIFRARYRTTEVDPFAVLGASDRKGRWGGVAATEAQLKALEKCGIAIPGIDKGQASALMDRIVGRSKDGLCTFKMARQLARFGLNPDVGFDKARWALDAIRETGWKYAPANVAQDPALQPPKKPEGKN